jgi:hypothetical protein
VVRQKLPVIVYVKHRREEHFAVLPALPTSLRWTISSPRRRAGKAPTP